MIRYFATMTASGEYLLRTARLGLRRWKDSDQEVFAAMNLDPEVRRYFPGLATPAESADSIAGFEVHFEQHGYTFYAVDVMETGAFIGFVGLYRTTIDIWFAPCVEIGWRLGRDAWGLGYATEAAKECLRFGFDELGLERIYSFTAVANLRSARVMQKIGMRFVGEFDHPRVEEGSWLRRHVLYEVSGTEEVVAMVGRDHV
jgi:ribosomal-protein-alanine N-acetyltransferase